MIPERIAHGLVGAGYAHLLQSELVKKPMDRAMFASFSEPVPATRNRTVADLGCGPVP